MGWRTAYVLYRTPTSIAAALASLQMADAVASLIGLALGTSREVAYTVISTAMAVLIAVLLGAVVAIHHVEDVAYAATVVWCLVSLIGAAHTQLVVKGLCVAITVAVILRGLIKAYPDD